MNSVRKISLIGIFLGLSIAGASIKIPAIVSSVALDMVPALVAGVILGAGAGSVIGGIGHLLSAIIGGMPLGPFHFLITIEMAVLVFIFSIIYQSGRRYFSSILFVIINTFIAPMPFLFLLGSEFYLASIPSLLIGSLLNMGLAFVLAPRLLTLINGRLRKEAIK
jgi:hypothetical protein